MHRELITEDRLRQLTAYFYTIKIIPVKKDKPIFILKDLIENSWTRGMFANRQIIMHDGKFIWENNIEVPSLPASAVLYHSLVCIDKYKTYSDYPKRFKKRCPSKEFSIQSILDIATIKSDKKHIKPIRDFLRKYKILKDRRGGGEKKNKYRKLIQERIKVNNKAYKEIIRARKQKTPFPIKPIQKRLEEYAGKRSYSNNPKEAERERKVFNVADVTIRRDIRSYMKK